MSCTTTATAASYTYRAPTSLLPSSYVTTTAARTLSLKSKTFTSPWAANFLTPKITATGLTEIADAVQPFRQNLPTIDQEIGDTWIYGVGSDPVKVARYRELARLRRSWIASGKFKSGDVTDVALLRKLLLEAEHTWGTDTKTWLDFDRYSPSGPGQNAGHKKLQSSRVQLE